MYVAVTRAREYLGLSVPATLYNRAAATTAPAEPSPFVRIIPSSLYEEWLEGFTGLAKRASFTAEPPAPRRSSYDFPPDDGEESNAPSFAVPFRNGTPGSETADASGGLVSPLQQGASGYCRHKVFGRGKIVQFLPPDKYRVNFPGMGLKVIMGAYLEMEE